MPDFYRFSYAIRLLVNVKYLNNAASSQNCLSRVRRDWNRMSPTVHPPSPPGAPAAGPDEQPSAHRVLKSVALLLARHEIRSLRRWFDDFDRDILLPILLGEIALHNIGALQNGVARRSGTRTGKALPVNGEVSAELISHLKPCNAYSIAAATGLPRETVRRKIVRLIELGWIHRRDNGHLFITETALAEFGTMLSSRALAELLETADHARRLLGEDD